MRGGRIFYRLGDFLGLLAREWFFTLSREYGQVHHVERGIFLDHVISIGVSCSDDLLFVVVARCAPIRGQRRELLTLFLDHAGTVLATAVLVALLGGTCRLEMCQWVIVAVGLLVSLGGFGSEIRPDIRQKVEEHVLRILLGQQGCQLDSVERKADILFFLVRLPYVFYRLRAHLFNLRLFLKVRFDPELPLELRDGLSVAQYLLLLLAFFALRLLDLDLGVVDELLKTRDGGDRSDDQVVGLRHVGTASGCLGFLLLIKFPAQLNHVLLAVVEARAQVAGRALIQVAGLLVRLRGLRLHLLSQRR